MRQIADKVGATYIFDMAHIAGLVAGGRASLSRAACAHHHHYHAQDTARTARGTDSLRTGVGRSGGQGGFPRPAGWSAGCIS